MKHIEEEATGLPQWSRKLGKYFADAEITLTPAEAYDRMRDGHGVEVPNAGSGSYKEFFADCGFTDVKAVQTGSSAGDWVFAVKDGKEGDWYPAFQENRWPRYGFTYSVNFDMGFETLEELYRSIE